MYKSDFILVLIGYHPVNHVGRKVKPKTLTIIYDHKQFFIKINYLPTIFLQFIVNFSASFRVIINFPEFDAHI